MWSFCYGDKMLELDEKKIRKGKPLGLPYQGSIVTQRRNDMRPKSKPQWETEYANVYCDSSDVPLATFVTHVNRLTGEVK